MEGGGFVVDHYGLDVLGFRDGQVGRTRLRRGWAVRSGV